MKWLLRAWMVSAVMLAAQEARASTFTAGSLIIPLDECYQGGATNNAAWSPSPNPAVREGWDPAGAACTYWDATSTAAPGSTNGDPYDGTCWAALTAGYGAASTGVQHAFGVLYLLARNGIPVSVIMNGQKQALGDYDFFVSPGDNRNPTYYLRWSGGAYTANEMASTGGKAIYYRGAPFVIDAAYAQAALTVLAASNASNTIFSDVMIHVARADFSAPVLSVIATTPKPVGIVSYGNSNGFNIAVKYLNDAGIVYALNGSGNPAYVTISLTKQGALSFTWNGTKYSRLANLASGIWSRVLDVVWAPDITQNTCQNVLANPNCFDSTTGLCQADTCLGVNAWCCPGTSTTLPDCSTVTGSTPCSFNYNNPDGTTTQYLCPCSAAGTSGSSDLCSVTDWQYNNTICYNPVGTNSFNTTACPGTKNNTLCDFNTQQCETKCNNDNGCPTGSKCLQPANAGSCGSCPFDYSCSGGVCVANSKVCVVQSDGTNPVASTPCSPACDSTTYCDPNTKTCVPRWGCEVTCNSCPGGASGQVSNVWSSFVGSSGAGGLTDFLVAGGTILGTDSSAITAEQTQHWLASGGLGSSTAGSASGAVFCASDQTTTASAATAGFTGTPANYPSSNINLQIGDYLYRVLGGNSPTYTPSVGWTNNRVNTLAYQSGGSWAYPVVTGPPGTCTLTGNCYTCTVPNGTTCQYDPSQCTTPANKCGTVVYEGANNYGSSSNSAPLVKLAGQHIVYDTLLQGSSDGPGTGPNPNPSTALELSRSPAIQNPITGQFFVGTFDWKYTTPSTGLGFTQWTPTPGTYPYTTGHFRQYTPAGSDVNTTFLNGNASDWDANTWLTGNGGTPPARTLYFPSKSGSTWSWLALSTANATAAAKLMYSTSSPTAAQVTTATAIITKMLANHSLGGVDFNSPAVIDAPHGLVSGNGVQRPTVAYVGARDGMLHAICVAAKGGTAASPGQCYGKNPGVELWAVIPPEIMPLLPQAYSSGDWSTVNVGGAFRVGDVYDYLQSANPTVKAWKTVLIYGIRGSTGVGAMDITDPNPTYLTTTANDDLRFLWSLTSSNTTPAMGPSLGATIATPSNTGVAMISSATSGAAAGVNVYMVKIADGSILASTTITYTKSMPTGISSTPIPNSAPALLTVLDKNGGANDNLALGTTPQGDVFSVNISTSSFSGVSPYYTKIFDASASAGCTTACQPFSSSVAIARRVSTTDYVALVASGGTDWASTASTMRYYLYGVSPTATTLGPAMFSRGLGTLTVPVPGGSNGATQIMPVRAYAQPTVTGSDLYIDGTTLSLGNVNQLLNPVLYPGTWGEAIRYGLGTDPSASTVSSAVYLLPASGSFGGGFGSAVYTGGDIIDAGSHGIVQHKVTPTELATTDNTSALAKSLKIFSTTTRPFSTTSWFQLGE